MVSNCQRICENYFNVYEKANCKKYPAKVNAVAVLIMLTWLTILPLIVFGIALGISKLCCNRRIQNANLNPVLNRHGGHLPARAMGQNPEWNEVAKNILSRNVLDPQASHQPNPRIREAEDNRPMGEQPEWNEVVGKALDGIDHIFINNKKYFISELVDHIFDRRGDFTLSDGTKMADEDIKQLLMFPEANTIKIVYEGHVGRPHLTPDEIIHYWKANPIVIPESEDEGFEDVVEVNQDEPIVEDAKVQSQPVAQEPSKEDEEITLRGIKVINHETVICMQNVEEIPDEYLFISESKHAYSIKEMNGMNRLINEFTQSPFSDADLKELNRLSKLAPDFKKLREMLDALGMH